MYCLRNLRRSAQKCGTNILSCHGKECGNHSNRQMSLLRPTIREKVNNALLPAFYMVKNNRPPTLAEDRLMLRQQMARRTMGETLLNSVVKSMLRTDYVRSLNMPDTLGSHVTLLSLHMYPLLIRLQHIPNSEVRTLRKKILITKLFEDLKARLRKNKMDMLTTRRALNKYTQAQQMTYLRLDEGITSLSGKELGGAIARILYRTTDGGECTMQHLLTLSEWLLETLDILQSYTNEELVELCVFGEGFEYPLLGEYRPLQPDKLYTYHDIEELGGVLPEHIQHLAAVVHKKL